MLFNVIPVSAAEVDTSMSQDSGDIMVASYEQLKNLMYNTNLNTRLMLANYIIVTDNTNDNTLVVSGFSSCNLDLNGYTLSRTTRGIDNRLIDVDGDGFVTIKDATFVQSYIGKLISESELNMSTANVDDDNLVTIKDATKIQMIVGKLI